MILCICAHYSYISNQILGRSFKVPSITEMNFEHLANPEFMTKSSSPTIKYPDETDGCLSLTAYEGSTVRIPTKEDLSTLIEAPGIFILKSSDVDACQCKGWSHPSFVRIGLPSIHGVISREKHSNDEMYPLASSQYIWKLCNTFPTELGGKLGSQNGYQEDSMLQSHNLHPTLYFHPFKYKPRKHQYCEG